MKRTIPILAIAVALVVVGNATVSAAENQQSLRQNLSITKADGRLSAELQRALEAASAVEDLQKIIVLCANSCPAENPNNGNSAATGKPADTQLNSGGNSKRVPERLRHKQRADFLSCIGAGACVKAIAQDDLCARGTVKCTSKGCGCKTK